MQHDEAIEIEYIPAEGPEGLWNVLNDLLEKSQSLPESQPAEYYLKYHIGSQVSLIKVDFHADPVHFWYYDLQGRPPTNSVKETIAKFLWEKCGMQAKLENVLKEEVDHDSDL